MSFLVLRSKGSCWDRASRAPRGAAGPPRQPGARRRSEAGGCEGCSAPGRRAGRVGGRADDGGDTQLRQRSARWLSRCHRSPSRVLTVQCRAAGSRRDRKRHIKCDAGPAGAAGGVQGLTCGRSRRWQVTPPLPLVSDAGMGLTGREDRATFTRCPRGPGPISTRRHVASAKRDGAGGLCPRGQADGRALRGVRNVSREPRRPAE